MNAFTLSATFPFRPRTPRFLTSNLIPSKRLAKHGDQRPVSRKKDCMCWLIYVAATCRNVKSDQRLTRSRHTGKETNQFSLLCSCFIKQFFYPI